MSKEVNGIDYGPLTLLIGNWEGDTGLDIAPEPDDVEQNPYYESLSFEEVGNVTNAESQTLVAVRYHQEVSRKSNDQVFHNQTGYWIWDAATGTLMHTFTIPRGVAVLAGGTLEKSGYSETSAVLEVQADSESQDWGIIQSPFMQDQAKTKTFRQKLTVTADELSYSQTMVLDIYGKVFDHTDSNTLKRCK